MCVESRASLLLLGFVPRRCRTHAPTQFEYWRRPSRLQKHLYPTCKHSIKSSRRMASLGSCSEDFRQKSFPMDSKACFSTYSGNQFLILWRSKRKRNDFRGTDNLASFNYRFYFPWKKIWKRERRKHIWYGKEPENWSRIMVAQISNRKFSIYADLILTDLPPQDPFYHE